MGEERKRRAFVIRDFSVENIGNSLDELRTWGVPGWTVHVAGPDTDLSKGRVFEDAVREDIQRSEKVIALCERTNANVAFEVGFALGMRKRTVLATTDSVEAKHLRDRAPFKGLGIQHVDGLPGLERCVTDCEGEWIERAPERGDETLFLCPHDGYGEPYRRCVARLKAEMELDWRSLQDDSWQLSQLPDLLDGIERVVWVIAPVGGSDLMLRDGQGNTAGAALAGFAHAHERKLKVLRAKSARHVADVASMAKDFESMAEFVECVRAIAAPAIPRPSKPRSPEELLGRYRKHLVAAHRELVPFFGDSTRRLDEVFVQVQLERDEPDLRGKGHARAELGIGHGPLTLRELLELPRDAGAGLTGRWLALGELGAGKSTLCRELCHRLGGEEGGILPVLVPLSAWTSDAESCDPFDWTERESRFVEDGGALEGLGQALRKEAEAGRAWLLFDGLDEVPKEERPRVLARIQELARKREFECAAVLVTSRPAAVERGELQGFEQARLQPLGPTDQRRLLEGWVGVDAAARALRQIEERPRMAELARNPLLLTLLAKLVDEGPELWDLDPDLPRNRGGLYERALDLLLRRGYAKARKEGVKDRFAATELLARLSLELQRAGGEGWPRKLVIERTWGLAKADPSLWPYFKPWDDAPERFVDDVGLNSGVLGPHDGPGAHWRYLHRSLREYLAAKAIVAGAEGDLVERLKEDTARWGEVTALVCGLLARDDSRRETLIEELVSSDHDLATRTLPQLEGLEVEEALDLLERVPEDKFGERWDGDDLLRVVKGLVLENHEPQVVLEAVMAQVSPELSTQELAYRLYALEGADLPIDRATFFRACGRWPESGEPESPPMLRIPPGTDAKVSFEMGSPEDEPGREEDEGPQHAVTLAAFLLAETPVTEAQYARFEAGPASDLPKVGLSWWEAWLYCRWIGGRLPTEAQWECACRAGTTTPFSTGSALTTDQANVSRRGDDWDSHNDPSSVRDHGANPWGLFDMHGNACEWCADWFGSYSLPVSEGDALRQVSGAVDRVYRGGSFGAPALLARSARRFNWHPRLRYRDLGCRPARGISSS